MGYKKDAIKGISWMSGGRVVIRVLTFLKIVVLARVLTPSQFGTFGVASLLLALLETLTETGINIVLIQSKKQLSEYIDSAWIVSILRGIFISLLLVISAPFIASFFHITNSLPLLFLISTVPFIRGFINPAEVKFQKELTFHLQFWFTSFLFLVDTLTSITAALLTHSVYSLVLGMAVSALVEVILSFALIKPTPKFSIDKKYFSEIFHKGIWVTGYTIFNYFAENGDNIVVGRVLGSSSLGLYQMAYKISILPITEISNVVSSVVFPVYTKISNEKARLFSAFFKTILFVFLCSAIAGLFIVLFSEQIIRLLLGEQWLDAASVLKVLAIYGVLKTISGPASALFLSIGKQQLVALMTFVRFATLVVVIYPLIQAYGLLGAGYAQVIAVGVETPLIFFLIYKIFKSNIVINESRTMV